MHSPWRAHLPGRRCERGESGSSRRGRTGRHARVRRGVLRQSLDGLKSTLQKIVTGLDDMPSLMGDAAYRAVISTDLMLEDRELRPFVETAEATIWMAPGRHLVGYCIVSATARAPFFSLKRLLHAIAMQEFSCLNRKVFDLPSGYECACSDGSGPRNILSILNK